jgi:hypothetical protein
MCCEVILSLDELLLCTECSVLLLEMSVSFFFSLLNLGAFFNLICEVINNTLLIFDLLLQLGKFCILLSDCCSVFFELFFLKFEDFLSLHFA